MLTGQVKSFDDLPEGDIRRSMPRFAPENFDTNLKLVQELEKIAKQKGCTPAQLALGWVRHLSKKDGNPTIIPIPGATKEERVTENAMEVSLSDKEIKEIDSILKSFEVAGDRYGGHAATLLNG
jgi:pyridoxine 4-dehydrogenase